MKRVPKPIFFVVALLILAFTFSAFFGVAYYTGDIKHTVVKGIGDIRWGIDIRGGVEATFKPADDYDASDEQLEMLENGEMEEDDIRDWHYESLIHSVDGQWMEEYKFQFGESEFQRVLIQENLIDIEELAKYCVDVDGVGHFIASYDGDET